MFTINSGFLKNKRLLLPDAKFSRPTSAKSKQAMFNILEHQFNLDFNNLNVLDVFAGSGAIGLESFSKGAKCVYFVENNEKILNTLEKNVRNCTKNVSDGVIKIFTNVNQIDDVQFDLIFLDPPYNSFLEEKIISILLKNKLISDNAVIVLECQKDTNNNDNEKLIKIDERIYGLAKFIFYKVEDGFN